MSNAPQQPPSLEAYIAAIEHHKDHPVHFDTTVLSLRMLLSTLHLSLRHPHFPTNARPFVEGFVSVAIEHLEHLDPVLTQMLRAGNAEAHDIEV